MVEKLLKRFKNLISRKEPESLFESCDSCKQPLHILKTTPVDQRPYYVDCIGQFCKECYDVLYMEDSHKNYPVFGYE